MRLDETPTYLAATIARIPEVRARDRFRVPLPPTFLPMFEAFWARCRELVAATREILLIDKNKVASRAPVRISLIAVHIDKCHEQTNFEG
jgi:hypothetical protein